MTIFPDYTKIRTDHLQDDRLSRNNIRMAFLRLDLLHPLISGNKWFKLKYNLAAASGERKNTVLTFGGAYSNHISATAAACKIFGLRSIGIIRGEEPPAWSPTLLQARSDGMLLHFVSREEYKRKEENDFTTSLREQFGDSFIIPEGGNNLWGVKGAEEILKSTSLDLSSFTHICCATGTGTTMAGLSHAAGKERAVIGFPALKNTVPSSSRLVTDYHFGGYARYSPALIGFMNKFYEDFNIPLDFIYTGKMVYGVMDLIGKGYFQAGSNLLIIHSGGLQGNLSLPPGILFF